VAHEGTGAQIGTSGVQQASHAQPALLPRKPGTGTRSIAGAAQRQQWLVQTDLARVSCTDRWRQERHPRRP
jgi:hypothetical protein